MWVYQLLATVVVVAVILWWSWRRLERERLHVLRLQRQHSQLERDLADFRDKAQARELAVLNSMAEGVLLLDPTGRVRLSNRATAEIFGVRYDIRGQTLLEAFHLDSLQEVFRRVLEDGRVVNVELELPSEERRVIQVDATVLLGERGEKEGILLECRDQTRVRQLENTRREFVANVSHELRTPLSLIKGYTETLLHGAKDDPQVAEKFLHTIERHADRLTYLIEDLLIISQLDSRKAVMSVQSFSLAGLVDDVMADLGPKAEDREVVLTNLVDGGIEVAAEKNRLQQVLFNLIDNAVKYGREGGSVRVEADPPEGDWVRVRVVDDGPGIPEAALERVFERFYRVDKARSREQGGTGLGLAIVKHIIQSHGGEVWVESDSGRGTTFFLTLPVAQG